MDDSALLRRSLRRCSAALIVALGVVTYAPDGGSVAGVVLALAGIGYLAASLVYAPEWSFADRPAEE